MTKKVQCILILLTIFTISFICGQSMVPEKKSLSESQTITEKVIQPIEEKITGERNITNALVRKWAHGIEHCILGVELFLLLFRKENFLISWILAISYGIGVALLDETIQLLSQRGALIEDVWIDGQGVLIGTFIGFGIYKLLRLERKETQHEIN